MVPPGVEPLIVPSLPVEVDPPEVPEPVDPLMLPDVDPLDDEPLRDREPRRLRAVPRVEVPVLVPDWVPMLESVPDVPIEPVDWPVPIESVVD